MDANEFAKAPAAYKSGVWHYFFVSNDKTRVMCQKCQTISRYTGNTTNMQLHLKRHHANDVPLLENKKLAKSSHPATPVSSGPLTNFFVSSTKLPDAKTRAITTAIATYIVKDLRPFSIVENEGFMQLMRILEPRYKLPNRKTLSKSTIPNMYERTKEIVKADVSTADTVALTTDGWTSRSTEGYITITSHHITTEWTLRSYVLQTRVIDESHTGVNIGRVLTEAVTEWQLKGDQIVLVTDNAANMGVAAEVAEMLNIPCFAHSLNLGTQKSLKLPKIATLLARVRRIVGFFHRSSVAFSLLRKNQELLNLPKIKLKMDVVTRWNSTYDMIHSYLQLQPAIYSTLVSKDLKSKRDNDLVTLSENDVRALETLSELLKPLKTATEVLCDEKNPTISVVAPMLHLIKSQMVVKDEDRPLVKDIKMTITADLQKRYVKPEVTALLHKSSALDPRFKALPFLNEEEKAALTVSLVTSSAQHFDRNKPVGSVKKESVTAVGQETPALPNLPTPPALPQMIDDAVAADTKHSVSSISSESSGTLSKLFGDVFVFKMEPPPQSMETRVLAQAEYDNT